ncbi:cytochrome P450 4C1-like [Pieris napi]|uniref:cytochrome P450 4C1-like n=1 Tax=Pieris napi TaxID=78633 RepID=UPI001FBBDC63|nr:cytochrome P450 4C1-like [Pieris napi]
MFEDPESIKVFSYGLIAAMTFLCMSIWFSWRYKNRRLLLMATQIPGPPVVPLFGNALKFMCRSEDLTTIIKDIIQEYGDVLRFWLGPDLNIVVSNPEDVKTLLTSAKTSMKGPQYKYMADILGGGILSGSGSVWRKHRKIVTPNYAKRSVECYSNIFNKETDYLIQNLQKVPESKEINIYKYIIQCTTMVVCQTIMGLTRDESIGIPHLQEIIEISPKLYEIIFGRMTKWYLQIDPVFWTTESYKTQKHFLALMPNFAKYIIDIRKSKLCATKNYSWESSDENMEETSHLSVVDRFLLSEQLTTEELIQEIFTLFTSSQEASGKICSYLLLMMAFNPHYQEKLYSEIEKVVGNKDSLLTDEDFKRMPYLEMAYKEVLRLFPIGAMIQRTVLEDIQIRSCTIPAGSSLVVPIYHIQRDERFWENPNDFDPDRFNAENTEHRHLFSYIPFSLGPMDCLGRYFGTKLIKTIAVRILQNFKLSSRNSYKDLHLAIKISVFSVNGYPVILTPRNRI